MKFLNNTLRQKPTGSNELFDYIKQDELPRFIVDPEFKYRSCDYTSIINYHLHDLEMTFGSIWVWSNPRKTYFNLFNHHVWNIDENDNIYDDFDSLEFVINQTNEEYNTKINVDVRKDEYRFFDGSKLKVTTNQEEDEIRIGKILKKTFHKPLKTPKMIFVSEVSWKNQDFTPQTWETMEERWEKIEKGHVVDYIQN